MASIAEKVTDIVCDQLGVPREKVTPETSFINGLLQYITSGIYASQSVTVRCSATSSAQARATQPGVRR